MSGSSDFLEAGVRIVPDRSLGLGGLLSCWTGPVQYYAAKPFKFAARTEVDKFVVFVGEHIGCYPKPGRIDHSPPTDV